MANAAATRGSANNKGNFGSLFVRMGQFLKESYIEVVKKASWPTWPELKKSTLVVIIAVLIVTIWIGGLDFLLSRITEGYIKAAGR